MGGNKNAVLVLDLDRTLVNSESDNIEVALSMLKDGNSRCKQLDFPNNKIMYTIARPGAKSFIQYCRNNFSNVVVWTAGTKIYAEAVVEYLFGQNKPLLLSRDDCYTHETTLTKPLAILSELLGVHPNKIIIIDDQDYPIVFNPNNRIKIPEYLPQTGADDEDVALYNLQQFFESPKFTMYRYPIDCEKDSICWTC